MTTDEIQPEAKTTAPVEAPAEATASGVHPLVWVALAVFVIAGAAAIYSGVVGRASADSKLKQDTQHDAIPTVKVTHPKMDAPTEEVVLPGNTQAFTDTPIYARTNGYLKHWYFDIGAHVKQGDLLADIETPEVDQQLQQAKAELATAQANLNLAKSTAARWQDLLKTDSVSKQETDEKIGDLNAKLAIVNSAESNVHRLSDTQSFQKIYAPFDGVLTARNVDVGSLIDAGASTPGKELFHLTAIQKLRVYVSVPEVYSRAAKAGAHAALTLDEYPGRSFEGTLVRTSNSIDLVSRTLLTEVDVDNPTGQLLPGAYVFVHLKLPEQIRSVTLPANALLFRAEGLRVAVVRDDKAVLTPVTLGRDYGSTVEVVSGLQPTDNVILDPADSLVTGTPVRVASGDAKAGDSK